MLPNDDFKAEQVSGEPLEFPMPVAHVGQLVWNGPVEGWRTPVSFELLTVDQITAFVKSAQGRFIDNAPYSIQLTQQQVYDFGLLYDLTVSDNFLARWINLHGFVRTEASGWRTKQEFFLAPQGDAFEIWVHVLDDQAKPVGLSGLDDFLWTLRSTSGDLVLSRQLTVDSYIGVQDNVVIFLLGSEETEGLAGRYLQEAQALFSDGTVYTLFKGSAEFIRTKE